MPPLSLTAQVSPRGSKYEKALWSSSLCRCGDLQMIGVGKWGDLGVPRNLGRKPHQNEDHNQGPSFSLACLPISTA